MPSGISSPNDEVYSIFQILIDPTESSVDKGFRRVAVRGFRAKDASRPIASMAGVVFFGRRVGLIEPVRVEIWQTSVVYRGFGGNLARYTCNV